MKNAGYTIEEFEATYYEDSFKYSGIVLAHNKKTNQWCTWYFLCNERESITENRWSFYWGHYFDREQDARADYHRRLLAEYEK